MSYNRIIVDAMGGDYAPRMAVQGAVQAATELGVDITLVGQSAAIKKGINASDKKTEVYLFMVADQPFIDEITINKIIAMYKKNLKSIIVPLYGFQKGNPVLFPSLFKKDLLEIKGDIGGRVIINKYRDKTKYIKIDNNHIGIDIDAEKDLEQI